MAAQLQYKCPCCGGAIEFHAEKQVLQCPYCDTEFDIDTLDAYQNELTHESHEDPVWQTDGGQTWEETEKAKMGVWACHSCGGEIVTDETTGAAMCPWCGSPVVFSHQFDGDRKPDLIIPFKLNKKAAIEGLTKHLSGKKLLPGVFKDQNRMESIQGVYVPVWLFDTEAEGEVRYRCSRSRTWRDSRYIYTETKYYAVTRSGRMTFGDIPVDGSTKMADDLMESVEPYDLSDREDFKTAYLTGYIADTYDVSAEASVPRANARVKESLERAIGETVLREYDTALPENTSIQYRGSQVRYALYPVWVMQTKWQGQNYLFAMNGQNGKFVGNLPMDKKAWWKWFLVYAGIASVAVYLLAWLFLTL